VAAKPLGRVENVKEQAAPRVNVCPTHSEGAGIKRKVEEAQREDEVRPGKNGKLNHLKARNNLNPPNASAREKAGSNRNLLAVQNFIQGEGITKLKKELVDRAAQWGVPVGERKSGYRTGSQHEKGGRGPPSLGKCSRKYK